MHHLRNLLPFVKPYWRRALAALLLLTSLVFMDLAIPRLIQRLIDPIHIAAQGTHSSQFKGQAI